MEAAAASGPARVIAYDDSATTTEETAVTLDVTANDAPVGMTVDAVVSPPASGRAEVVGSTEVRYSPAAGFSGTDRFEYRACTDGGACDVAVVTVRVEGENHAPVAAADTARTSIDTPVRIEVLRNDADPDGDTLRISSITQHGHGRSPPTARRSPTSPPPASREKTGSPTGCVTVGGCAPTPRWRSSWSPDRLSPTRLGLVAAPRYRWGRK